MNVTELATIVDVPIIHAGTFHPHNSDEPYVVEEEELDEIVEGSTKLLPLIKESIETGAYRGNEQLTKNLRSPIPGLLNIKHQAPFVSQELSQQFNALVKDAVKGIDVSFHKKLIDGKNWVVKRFHNVRNDIAETLQKQFPLRSSEFISLTDPDTGRFYPKVERSTAFLDILTRPAVPGQTPELVVEFAAKEEPITIVTTNQPMEEQNIMADTPQKEQAVDVAELQKQIEATLTEKYDAKIAELQAKANEAEAAKTENERLKEHVTELRKAQDASDAEKAIVKLSRNRTEGGRVLTASPAFLEIVTPHFQRGVIELQEGQHPRQALSEMCESIIELAAKGKIVVDITPGNTDTLTRTTAEKNETEQVNDLIAELMGQNKQLTYEEAEKAAFIEVQNRIYGGQTQ